MMNPQNSAQMDDISEMSEGTLSRSNSIERIGLPDGVVEERFRVDRRKLEAMILGKFFFTYFYYAKAVKLFKKMTFYCINYISL